MKNNLIAISGKKGSGKDTVFLIIKYLLDKTLNHLSFSEWLEATKFENPKHYTYENKKFADKLKQGCENDFPTEFSVEKWGTGNREYRDEVMASLGITRRDFLLKKGDALRSVDIDYFVKALFSEYKNSDLGKLKLRRAQNQKAVAAALQGEYLPNWIITDLRFPNELKAIEDREGVTIRVNKDLDFNITDGNEVIKNVCKTIDIRGYDDFVYRDKQGVVYRVRDNWSKIIEHESETALDFADFNFVIDNNGSIEDLIEEVKEILKQIGVL